MIQNIDINSLHPHPDNPRRDLGDLVELAESIKARGIMQNLTVTPGHEMSAAKWIELSREYQKKPTEELREQINNRFEQDGYTVVIGHRRLAAAKLAGLEKLPCAVVEMTKKEQVATMLLENMQRADLTVYEQAQGFQMMLNFGETVQDIAEKTGFSKTTIRHRTKLLELDPEKFKESAAREVTLADYIKLEQIKDIDLRNGVLESIGTNNFDWELREAINHEEYKERKAVWAAALKEFAEEIKSASIIYTQGKQIVGNYSLNQSIELLDVPEDADTVNYFYQISAYGDVRIYQEGTMNEVDYQQTPENIVLTKFNNAAEHAYKLRQDFVKNYKGAKKHMPAIMEFWVRSRLIIYFSCFNNKRVTELLGIDLNNEPLVKGVISRFETSPERVVFAVAYSELEDRKHEGYYHITQEDGYPVYKKNNKLDLLYEILQKLGYQMSDDEIALRDGTHELFGGEATQSDNKG